MCLYVFNRNYVTADVTVPLVIYIIISMIIFLIKCQLSRKLLYIINIVSITKRFRTCNCIFTITSLFTEWTWKLI